MSNNTLPTMNVPLLRDLVCWAAADEAHLQDLAKEFDGWGQWDQNVWSREVRNGVCRTAYCIAGQAVAQVGMGFVYDYDHEDDNGHEVYAAAFCAPKTFVGLDDKGQPQYELDRSREEYVSSTAKRAIGLSDNEGSALFGGDNTITEVVGLALMFAERRGVDLGLPPEVAELAEGFDRTPYLTWMYPQQNCETCGQVVPF